VTNLGYVFQDATLLPWRTVQKNVELLAYSRGASTEAALTGCEAIKLVGLRASRATPKTLSGHADADSRALTTTAALPARRLFGALDEITRGTLNEG
jgi:NitT/TauT family transport system ATP-binding protein